MALFMVVEHYLSGPGPVYARFAEPSITAPGTAAVFFAQFQPGAGDDGLFIGSGGEVDPVIQVGDALFGSTVTFLEFSRGLNNRGEIAFRYSLANGVIGIALAKPAAPAPAVCICEVDGVIPVDVFDLLSYLNEWFNSTPAADIDGVPGVDVFDLLFFLNCWFPASAGAPCP